jgi:type I restriction enzyme S subunit
LYPYYGATGQVGLIDGFIFDGEHILLGEDGAPFLDPFKEKAYLATGRYWVNNHAHIIKAKLSNKYLCHYLNQVDYSDHVTGTTRLKLTQAALRQIPVHIAPEEVQYRIVAKIEELFSKLDKGTESLRSAREQLNVYRQAVLKHAFEGRLTARWRDDNVDKLESADQLLLRINQEREACYEQQLDVWNASIRDGKAHGKQGKRPKKCDQAEHPESSAVEALPALPTGWHWVPLSWLLSITKKPMTTGPFGTMLKKTEHQTSGVPVLGIENIGEGKFLAGNKIYVTSEKAKQLNSFEVAHGEVIISRSGTVGEICEVPQGLGTTLISTNLLRLSLNRNVVLSQFFVFLFQGGGSVKGQVKELCKGSSRDFLNQSILQSIMFPLCSPSEQCEVLKAIEEKLSRIEKMIEEIDDNLLRLETLRQSILRRAFSGDLVSENGNDEPAAVFLDRIKAIEQEKSKKCNTRKAAA